MNRIQQFIKDNNIDLTGTGSDLNGQCVIVAGFALYDSNDVANFSKLVDDIEENEIFKLSIEAETELKRVYDYAYSNNYFEFWNTEDAKNQYKF